MNNRQFFILVLALVYYLLSLALLSMPLLYSRQQAELIALYPEFLTPNAFYNPLLLILVLHAFVITSLILTAFISKKTGLWMLVICAGIWLTLQFTRGEGLNLFRPFAEIFILSLFILAFEPKRAKRSEVKPDTETSDSQR